MSDLEKTLGAKPRIKHHKTKPQAGAKSVMNLEATVVNKPQELRKLRSFFAASLLIPGDLSAQGQIVLKLLFDCFSKQGAVKEGMIGDLCWGFEQATPPIPQKLSIDGLRALEKAGYVKFQAKDGALVGFDSDKITSAWVRYQPKLLGMVYEGR
jgi:hypothetical protein